MLRLRLMAGRSDGREVVEVRRGVRALLAKGGCSSGNWQEKVAFLAWIGKIKIKITDDDSFSSSYLYFADCMNLIRG